MEANWCVMMAQVPSMLNHNQIIWFRYNQISSVKFNGYAYICICLENKFSPAMFAYCHIRYQWNSESCYFLTSIRENFPYICVLYFGWRDFERLTRISSPPNVSRSHRAKPWIEVGFATSNWRNWTWSPWLLRDSTARIPLETSLEVRTTVSPSSASRLTMASPIPLFAPVTTATVSWDHHLQC